MTRYPSSVLASLALGLCLVSGCDDDKPCPVPPTPRCDGGSFDMAGDMARDMVSPAMSVSVDLSKFMANACGADWKYDNGTSSLRFLQPPPSCMYGLNAVCLGYINVPIDVSSLGIGKNLKIELTHKFQMVSGVNAPPLSDPTNVRIYQGFISVYDKDPMVGTPSGPSQISMGS